MSTTTISTTVVVPTIDDVFASLDRADSLTKQVKKEARDGISDIVAADLRLTFEALDVHKSVSARALAERGSKEKRKGLGSAASWRTRARAGRLLSLPVGDSEVDAVTVLGKVREHGEMFGAQNTSDIIDNASDQREAFEDIVADIKAVKDQEDKVLVAALVVARESAKVGTLLEKGLPLTDEARTALIEAQVLLAELLG